MKKQSLKKRFMPLLAALLVLVLVAAVAAPTIAYYIRIGGKVESEYTPAEPSEPSFTLDAIDNKVENVTVSVPDLGYPVYVRVAIIFTWQKLADCTCEIPRCNSDKCTDCEDCPECEEGTCTDCKNCTDCKGCTEVVKCEGCKNCPDCDEECTDCTENCTDCDNCKETTGCENCPECEEGTCTDCKNCIDCKGCTEVVKCEDCKNCPDCDEECTDCTQNCTDCEGCKKNAGCNDCSDCKDKNCKGCEDCPKCNVDPDDDWDVFLASPVRSNDGNDGDYKLKLGDKWTTWENSEFYYCTSAIQSRYPNYTSTPLTVPVLIEICELLSTANPPLEGCVLNVEIIVQTVQAIGFTDPDENNNETPAWKDAWENAPNLKIIEY